MHPITYYENHLVVTFADVSDKGVTAVRFLRKQGHCDKISNDNFCIE